MDNPTSKHIILASNSPRRRQLLGYIANDFTIAPSRDIDEQYPDDLEADLVAPYLSRVKAEGYADLVGPDDMLVTADTVVILDDDVLGKPHSRDEAIAMLMRLSGRRHRVVTGVSLMTTEHVRTFAETTYVTFGEISPADIESYVDQYKPMDKAGAYGIQEWIGCVAISGIEGCFYNVMGLPLHTLYRRMKEFGATCYRGSTSK